VPLLLLGTRSFLISSEGTSSLASLGPAFGEDYDKNKEKKQKTEFFSAVQFTFET
jgi:hypothetical protein